MPERFYSVIASDGKRQDLVDETLHSLSECEIPSSYNGLLLIENNCSPKLQACLQRQFPFPVFYRSLARSNKSAALNLALEEIRSGFFYFHDDDIRFSKGALRAMAEAFEKYPSEVFFGGPLDVIYDVPPAEWLMPYLPRSVRGWSLDADEVVHFGKPQLLGGNWAARVDDLRRIGGFCEVVGPGQLAVGQETLAEERLISMGLKSFYVPGARVMHYAPAKNCTPEFALKRTRLVGVYQGLTFERNGAALLRRVLEVFFDLARIYLNRVKPSSAQKEVQLFEKRYRLANQWGILKGLLSAKRISVRKDK